MVQSFCSLFWTNSSGMKKKCSSLTRLRYKCISIFAKENLFLSKEISPIEIKSIAPRNFDNFWLVCISNDKQIVTYWHLLLVRVTKTIWFTLARTFGLDSDYPLDLSTIYTTSASQHLRRKYTITKCNLVHSLQEYRSADPLHYHLVDKMHDKIEQLW